MRVIWLVVLTIFIHGAKGSAAVWIEPYVTAEPKYPFLFEKRGTVEMVDTVTSMVRLQSPVTPDNDSFTLDDFYVLSEAEIKNHNGPIRLDSLDLGSEVVVKYQQKPNGKSEIVSIWVED